MDWFIDCMFVYTFIHLI